MLSSSFQPNAAPTGGKHGTVANICSGHAPQCPKEPVPSQRGFVCAPQHSVAQGTQAHLRPPWRCLWVTVKGTLVVSCLGTMSMFLTCLQNNACSVAMSGAAQHRERRCCSPSSSWDRNRQTGVGVGGGWASEAHLAARTMAYSCRLSSFCSRRTSVPILLCVGHNLLRSDSLRGHI